jgi:hypothetical protein
MMVTPSVPRRLRFPLSLWSSVLVGFLVIKAVLSLGLGLGEKLALYGSGAYLLLLLLATAFAILNAVEKTLGRRPFWVFISIGYGLWSLDQWL